MTAQEQYAFGEFTLDVNERRLMKLGCDVPLAPKAYDLLVALVRQAGRLVTKRELLEQVWPASFVEEGILSVHVSALRKALGQADLQHSLIETVPRAGYRFEGAVTRPIEAQPPQDRGLRLARATRPEVYELVGRGRAHLLSAAPAEVPLAVAAFRAALELDPSYAPAHAGLARACCARASFRLAPAADAYREAKTAALCALAMDEACADAQVALATVMFLSEWNWAGAERSLVRAIAISPTHTEAYLLYGQLLEALGRLAEGLEMKQRALERDPSSALVHVQIALSYWNQRRYDDSIAWANKALELNPAHLLAREHLAGAYLKKGDFDRHMAENVRHAETHGVPAEALAPLRQAFADGGRVGVLQFAIRQLSQNVHPAAALGLAVLHAEAGEIDSAFRHLEQAMEIRDPALVYLAVAPQWDGLRGDPRLEECLKRMGLH